MKDCQGKNYPVYCRGFVSSCKAVNGAEPFGSVYLISIIADANPKPGQFFMLHPQRSNVILGRPISVFHVTKNEFDATEIQFLILVKGEGTQEICSLQEGEKINLLGPLGNTFSTKKLNLKNKKILIVGGGIGVAPVANFAENLPPKSYDFYASYKSGSYGLDYIKPNKLVITTDDGSVGIHGMLPVALTENAIKNENYAAIYACGPTPMLAYVKQVAENCDIPCFLSMESRMACGVGVCLGCVIETTEGKKRCCKDGPVFNSKILKFEKSDCVAGIKIQPKRKSLSKNPNLSVKIAGIDFKNPIIACSGTFGFGTEYSSVFDVNKLGGIASKGLTLEPRQGNNGIRLWETPSGLMNSIGLQNPGIPHFIKEELPQMLKLKPVAIANLSGSTLETYVEGAKLLEKSKVPVIELNISCPNVTAGGAAWGMTCSAAGQVVKAVRAVTKKPLIVKLTPQSLELNKVALECIESGADGISLCNSFQGIAVDVERGVPVFENLKAGVGGPAIRPIAVRLVYELVQAINTLPKEKQVPVIAIGGIANWRDAVEFIMVGASAVEVGTATFANPFAMIEIIDGIKDFMIRKGYEKIDDFRGIIQKCVD